MSDPKQKKQAITTAVYMPFATWLLLRNVAFRRQQNAGGGGKISVSKVIVDLIESRRKELQKESDDKHAIRS